MVSFALYCIASLTQVEARCQQVQEQAEEREQVLHNQISSVEEERIQAENQVKDLKENIFELEDQVEQQRAVNCHINQAALDMESMLVYSSLERNAFTHIWTGLKAAVIKCYY